MEKVKDMDWKKEISRLVLIKQELHQYDPHSLWPWHIPGTAANSTDIINVESKLGFKLPTEYAKMFEYINGWTGFFQTVDLFSLDDLLGSDLMKYAHTILMTLEQEGILHESGISLDDIFPIAATKLDLDIFVITKHDINTPGMVIWYAGQEIDRFTNLNEYFLSMIEYHEIGLKEIKEAYDKRN